MRFLIVLVDAGGTVAGWLDDRGLFTNCQWEAASFPTEGCAVEALRTTRRISHHRIEGCGWHLQRLEEPA